MTAAVKTAPKPGPKPGPKGKAPAPKPAAKPEAPATAPEAAPKAASRTGNSAYAAESVRNKIAESLDKLRGDGWTRPAISAVTGYTDSQVWRAFNRKVHEAEVPTILDFFQQVVDGKVKPPTSGRKPKIEELQARVTEAIELLSNEAKTAAQYRKIVDAALEVLADVVPAKAEDAASA